MTDKPAESAVERYENAETRILWRDEVARNVATKFVSKKEADDALAELQAKLAAAEAQVARAEWKLKRLRDEGVIKDDDLASLEAVFVEFHREAQQ